MIYCHFFLVVWVIHQQSDGILLHISSEPDADARVVSKCGETIYYGQHTRISVTRQQYHTYSCPTPEMNAILRALAAEYEDSEIYEDSESETAAREVARARRLRF